MLSVLAQGPARPSAGKSRNSPHTPGVAGIRWTDLDPKARRHSKTAAPLRTNSPVAKTSPLKKQTAASGVSCLSSYDPSAAFFQHRRRFQLRIDRADISRPACDALYTSSSLDASNTRWVHDESRPASVRQPRIHSRSGRHRHQRRQMRNAFQFEALASCRRSSP